MKEKFIKHVFDFLTSNGFVQRENQWLKEKVYKQPGSSMIINGQRFSPLNCLFQTVTSISANP